MLLRPQIVSRNNRFHTRARNWFHARKAPHAWVPHFCARELLRAPALASCLRQVSRRRWTAGRRICPIILRSSLRNAGRPSRISTSNVNMGQRENGAGGWVQDKGGVVLVFSRHACARTQMHPRLALKFPIAPVVTLIPAIICHLRPTTPPHFHHRSHASLYPERLHSRLFAVLAIIAASHLIAALALSAFSL